MVLGIRPTDGLESLRESPEAPRRGPRRQFFLEVLWTIRDGEGALVRSIPRVIPVEAPLTFVHLLPEPAGSITSGGGRDDSGSSLDSRGSGRGHGDGEDERRASRPGDREQSRGERRDRGNEEDNDSKEEREEEDRPDHPGDDQPEDPAGEPRGRFVRVEAGLVWDGMPEGGTDPVGEGLYPYILEAFFYRVDRKGKKERRRLIARSAAMTGTISVEAVLGPPVIDLVSPAEGAITTSGTITVAGTVTGEEPLTVTVSGNPVSLIDGAFSAESVLEEGPQVIEVRATDGSDRTVTVTRTVIRDSIAPVVQVVDPAPGSVIADPSPTIAIAYEDLGSGVVPSTLKVSVDETDVTTRFTPDPVGAVGTLPAGTILTDGEHQVLASVADAGGLVGAGLGVFTVDTTPPVLASVHPPAGAVLSTSMIRLSGVVLDLTPVEVEVNGIPAIMTGSEFVLEGLDLAEGANLIELTAVDVVGNRSTISHALVIDTQAPVVTLVSPAPDGAFRNRSVDLVFEVDDQTTTSLVLQGGGTSVSRVISPGSGAVTIPIELPADTTTGYTFHATDAAGNLSPVQTLELTHDETPPDPPVLFTRSIVTSNTRVGIDGCAEPGSTVEFLGGLGPTRTVAEEPMGKFSLEFDLGPDTTLTVRVRVIDAAGNTSAADEVRITQYTGTPPASVSSVVAVGGFAQQGLVGEALHQPLTVLVRTLDGLPLAGQDVLYRVMAGRMTLDGPTETQVTVRTDAAGRAGVTGFLSLDASVGDRPGDALVVATRPGPAGVPAIFDIAALPVRTDRPTSLSGYLEDSDERAIPGVEVHLHTPPFSTTVTDARGHFRFEDIPPGEHHFLLDGSTAALPGTYTDLVFKLECLPGQDNSLGMPIFLPRVDVDSGIDVSETEGGVLTNPELPGLEIHVAPGSATFPDGSNSGRLAVVAVPRDKTPMPFPEGLYGNFVIAVYPPGTHFDPPAKTIFPNVDPRLSPGDTAPLISFDHDVGDYVKVGTATVSPDGSRIISDPGYGIKVAAWHVTPPPDPPEYGCVEGRLKAPPGSCIVESECWTVNNRRLVNPVLGELPPGGVRVEICNVPRDELAGARLECRATSIRVEGPRQLVLDPLNADDQASTTPVVNRVYQVFSSDERFRSIRLVPEQDGVLTVTPSTVSGASPVMIESQGGAGRFRIRMIAPNGVVCDSVSVLVVPRILDLVRSTPAQGNFSVIRPDSLPLVLTQGDRKSVV